MSTHSELAYALLVGTDDDVQNILEWVGAAASVEESFAFCPRHKHGFHYDDGCYHCQTPPHPG